jgi:hypothetical protein
MVMEKESDLGMAVDLSAQWETCGLGFMVRRVEGDGCWFTFSAVTPSHCWPRRGAEEVKDRRIRDQRFLVVEGESEDRGFVRRLDGGFAWMRLWTRFVGQLDVGVGLRYKGVVSDAFWFKRERVVTIELVQ